MKLRNPLMRPRPTVSATEEKNARLNTNMTRFLSEIVGVERPPRETVLHPEVIIPCFNHAEFLPDAVHSAVSTGFAVTVVDDASTDDTARVAAGLAQRHAIKVLRNETNLQQWGTLNRAVAESPNNLFIVLNADDVLVRYAARALIDTFHQQPTVRLVGGGSIWFATPTTLRLNDVLPAALPYAPACTRYGEAQARRFTRVNDLEMTMSSCAFLRSAWSTVGGFRPFEERLCSFDDRDFQMRVSAAFEVGVVDVPLAFWRVGSSTST